MRASGATRVLPLPARPVEGMGGCHMKPRTACISVMANPRPVCGSGAVHWPVSACTATSSDVALRQHQSQAFAAMHSQT